MTSIRPLIKSQTGKSLTPRKVVKVQPNRECKLYESDNSSVNIENKSEAQPIGTKTTKKSKVLTILARRNETKDKQGHGPSSSIKETKRVLETVSSNRKELESDEFSESSSDSELKFDLSSMSLESLASFGTSSTRVRRLKSSHCRSIDKLWLPGKSTRTSSFNKNVSRRYSCCPDDNERNFGDYYYTNQNITKWCNHGKSNTNIVNK